MRFFFAVFADFLCDLCVKVFFERGREALLPWDSRITANKDAAKSVLSRV
jgi:hypothetical protein